MYNLTHFTSSQSRRRASDLTGPGPAKLLWQQVCRLLLPSAGASGRKGERHSTALVTLMRSEATTQLEVELCHPCWPFTMQAET